LFDALTIIELLSLILLVIMIASGVHMWQL
jgi:hypothetical protein